LIYEKGFHIFLAFLVGFGNEKKYFWIFKNISEHFKNISGYLKIFLNILKIFPDI